ncbi:MAG: hypothetical protein AAF399_24370 [Bacteroidota bacterium]
MDQNEATVQQTLIRIANQVFDLHKKVQRLEQKRSLERNLHRIQEALAELGLEIHDPTGEAYAETRTDCEASISGTHTSHLRITETLKPIIRWKHQGFGHIVQRAVVIVSGE